jgi:hypothetical protein
VAGGERLVKKNIHIIGGGTFSHVRNHLALAAPAFGKTARRLAALFLASTDWKEYNTFVRLTKMADPDSYLITNEDVAKLLDLLVAEPATRIIVLNAALCDYDGSVLEWEPGEISPDRTASGAHHPRLKTAHGEQRLILTPARKIIGEIRKTRKDIFVVGFKTTTGATVDEQYITALDLLKANSLNLVLANDTVTRMNVLVAPEETRYAETTDRDEALRRLVEITLSRASNTFTRSHVGPGDGVAWNSPLIPANLRTVVDYCVGAGAYKPFRGATAGHFAVRIDDNCILTTKRKTNYNELDGLVQVNYDGDDYVIAHGAKPSVGGQSQRVIFREHPDVDCIVHFHCPLRDDARDLIAVAPQWPNECGSHQCGQNTSDHLMEYVDHEHIKAVMLEEHGPNICFSRNTDPDTIIDFIDSNFDLSAKTGGLVA